MQSFEELLAAAMDHEQRAQAARNRGDYPQARIHDDSSRSYYAAAEKAVDAEQKQKEPAE